jgi:hypothetical protein
MGLSAGVPVKSRIGTSLLLISILKTIKRINGIGTRSVELEEIIFHYL